MLDYIKQSSFPLVTIRFVRKVSSWPAQFTFWCAKGHEASCQLVVSGTDTTIFFQPTESPLDDVVLSVFWAVGASGVRVWACEASYATGSPAALGIRRARSIVASRLTWLSFK